MERVREIVYALSDPYSKRIITATIEQAKSAKEICTEQKIPPSTCYRRIHDLVSLSILRVDKIEIRHGKKMTQYRSIYRDIFVEFDSNNLRVGLTRNGDSVPKVDISGTFLPNREVEHEMKTMTRERVILLNTRCDVCQSENLACKIFVTADSKSSLSVCESCAKRSSERKMIRAVQALRNAIRMMS